MPDAGDIVLVEFAGAQQTKRRPAVVLSSDEYHAQRPDLIVGLLTSNLAAATATTDHVLIDWQAANLRVPSAFRAYIGMVAKSAVSSPTGRVSQQDWEAIQRCVRKGFAI
jgi:mRNA interferase MazF